MRRHLAAIAVLACLAGCGSGPTVNHPEAAGSCAGPQLALSRHVAAPGATVTAAGKWFAADCYDTGQAGNPPPLTGLNLVVGQAGKTWQVASNVDAATPDYTFHVPVTLPDNLQPGTATVRVDGFGPPAMLHIQPTK